MFLKNTNAWTTLKDFIALDLSWTRAVSVFLFRDPRGFKITSADIRPREVFCCVIIVLLL